MARDTQRHKVYDAEQEFLRKTTQKQLTIRECQTFVNEVRSSQPWLSMRQSAFIIRVQHNPHFRRHIGMSRNRGRLIDVSVEGQNKVVLLHEMAHSMITDWYDDKLPDHGPEFMWVYRQLCEVHLSSKDFDRWRDIMAKHDVRWNGENLRFA